MKEEFLFLVIKFIWFVVASDYSLEILTLVLRDT